MSDYVMFQEPYFAVVKSAGLDEAIETYERDVGYEIEIPEHITKPIEDYAFRRRMHKLKSSKGKMIKKRHALAMFHKNEDGTVFFESERMLEKTPDNTTVIIDGNLI